MFSIGLRAKLFVAVLPLFAIPIVGLGYVREMEALLKEHSPLYQVEHMPDIDYLLVHGIEDTVVAKAAHSDRIVPAMQARGLRVNYAEVPGMGHCGPMPEETSAIVDAHMRKALAKRSG
jgi:dipeptidyl aminopeptidase/acylaminoacyl peptidase